MRKLLHKFFNSYYFGHDWKNWETDEYPYQWRYCKNCNKRQDKLL